MKKATARGALRMQEILDEDLQAYETIWAAGGTPNAVFRLTPADLARLTSARFLDVAKR